MPERELAERLDVSRPSLREAILKLADRGLLNTTRSGTHVAHFLSPLMRPLASLLEDRPEVTPDYFEFRQIVDGQAARYAATRASDIDRKAIQECIEDMKRAHEREDHELEARADLDFHLLIYEAAHNAILLHMMRAIVELMRNNIFYSRQQLYARNSVRIKLLEQHINIADAILSGDAERAAKAAEDHVRFTFKSVEEIRVSGMRLKASRLRGERDDYLA